MKFAVRLTVFGECRNLLVQLLILLFRSRDTFLKLLLHLFHQHGLTFFPLVYHSVHQVLEVHSEQRRHTQILVGHLCYERFLSRMPHSRHKRRG